MKIVPQLGCVSQHSDALVSQRGKQFRGNPMQKVLGSIRKVRFTQSTLRQASMREKKGPSLGKIQVKPPHQRSPFAMKFEDRSHEETERQQRCARRKLAKNIYKLKENDKATFYSPAEEWVLPAASTKEPDEREFVVDSGPSVHMVSKRDLNSAELETMSTSMSPTTVMTANGEVQTREEATVYVKGLDLFVTVTLPAVLSLGKLWEDRGYTYHWTSGQIPHLTKKGKRIDCKKSNFLPFVVSGLSTSSSFTPTPTSSSSSSQDSVFDESRYTENPISERSGSTSEQLRRNLQHKPTETENKNENDGREEVQSDLLHDLLDWLQDFRENLVDESCPTERKPLRLRIETVPVLLMNYQWSREQKWKQVRVSIVSTRTSRRTQIAISAWRRKKNEGYLQKTYWYSGAQSGKFWWLDNSRSQNSQRRKWIA